MSGGFGWGAMADAMHSERMYWTDWKHSREAVKDQRRWEERMSNTSYQRAVADMKAAGLNPMLAYHQGGASTPSTPAAGLPQARASTRFQEAELNSAQVALLREQKLKTNAEKQLIFAQVDQAAAGTGQALAQTKVLEETIPKIRAEIGEIGARTDLARLDGVLAGLSVVERQATIPLIIQMMQLQAQKEGLSLQEFLNENEKAKTIWGRYVTPYLKDVGILAGVASSAAGAYAGAAAGSKPRGGRR